MHRNIRLTTQPSDCPVPNCPLQKSRAVVWKPQWRTSSGGFGGMTDGFIIGRRCDRHALDLAQEWNDQGDSVYLIKVEA